jgi:CHASE3 domain sensor protein
MMQATIDAGEPLDRPFRDPDWCICNHQSERHGSIITKSNASSALKLTLVVIVIVIVIVVVGVILLSLLGNYAANHLNQG